MKKIIYRAVLGSLAASLLVFTSCKSTKKADSGKAAATGNLEVEASDVEETSEDYRFISVIKKYDAKMLTLSDVVQPGTTVTVYDFIKGNLTSQKQSQFLAQSAVEISKALDTPANVDRKKTGDDLTKLLEW